MFNRDANATNATNVTFEQRVARLREAVEAKKRAAMTEQEQFIADHPEDLLNEADLAGEGDAPKRYTRDFQDEIKQLSHRDVMARFGDPAKNHAAGPDRHGLFRCPEQGHQDNNPSARWDRDNGYKTWRCWSGTCDKTGDKLAFIGAVRGHWSAASPGNGWNNFGRFIEELKFELGYELADQDEDWGDAVDEEGEAVSSDAPTTPDTHPQPVEETPSGQMGTVSAPVAPYDDPSAPILKVEEVIPPGENFIRLWATESNKLGVPEQFGYVGAMSILASVIGRRAFLNVIGKPTYANLFMVLLLRSGMGKGLITKEVEETIDRVYPAVDDSAITGNLPYGVRTTGLPGSIEALIEEQDHIISDVFAGRPQTYKDIHPRSGKTHMTYSTLMIFDEMSSFIAKASITTSDFKGRLHAFFDANTKIESKAKKTGYDVAYKPYLNILTATTQKSLKKVYKREDLGSGFINRFVYIWTEPKFRDYRDLPDFPNYTIADAALRRIVGFLDVLNATSPAREAGGYEYGVLTHYEDGARMNQAEYLNYITDKYIREDEDDLYSRLPHYFMKFVLIYAINDMSMEIKNIHIEYAKKMVDYIALCYGAMSGAMSTTEMDEDLKKFVEKVRELEDKHNYPPSLRDLDRCLKVGTERLGVIADQLVRRYSWIEKCRTGSKSGKGNSSSAVTTNLSRWKPGQGYGPQGNKYVVPGWKNDN